VKLNCRDTVVKRGTCQGEKHRGYLPQVPNQSSFSFLQVAQAAAQLCYDGCDRKGLFFLYEEDRPNCIDNFVADCSKQHLVVQSVDRRMKNAAGTTQRRQVRHRDWLNSKEGYYMFVE